MHQFQEISHAYSILSDKQKRERYDRFGDDEELEGDADMEAFMAMFGEIFASMGAGGPGGLFGDLDDDDMDDFFMEMGGPGMGGMGMPPGMMGGFFRMDGEDLGSEEEEEILEEFMMAHSEQVPTPCLLPNLCLLVHVCVASFAELSSAWDAAEARRLFILTFLACVHVTIANRG